MEPTLRTFTDDDLGFALAQTAREGWNTTETTFRMCLAHDPGGCFVAEVDGAAVGMITATQYAQTGWVGNLIVVPTQRRCGIGARLMTEALAYLAARNVRAVRLEADPMGIGVYRRLGFEDQFESLRFFRTGAAPAGEVRDSIVEPADLSAVAAFDRECFGDDRGRLLKLLAGVSDATYWFDGEGGSHGYAMVLTSTSGVSLGPWGASDEAAACGLVDAAIRDYGAGPIVVGVPEVNPAAVEVLTSRGFRQVASCLRMVRGEQAGEASAERLFGIANGALG